MSRASNGTYTLPAGNPVVTGTVISSTWANTTLSDLATAMTDSLSRSGKGGMSASLALFDGLIGAPGLSWGTETTSGLYRVSAGVFAYSIAAAQALVLSATGIRVPDGAAGTPSLTFISDTDTGIFRQGANDMRLVAGGISQLLIRTDAVYSRLVNYGVPGSAAAPTYSFEADPDTGMWNSAANQLAWAAGGSNLMVLDSTSLTSTVPYRAPDGTAALPGFTFANDADSGIYRVGANSFSLVTGGTARISLDTVRFLSDLPFYGSDGTAGAPAYSFTNDTDTGIYRIGANRIGIALNGALAVDISTAGVNTSALAIFAIADGNVGSPAIQFNADTNTGFYRIGADNIGVSTGGTLAWQIDSGQRVIKPAQPSVDAMRITSSQTMTASAVTDIILNSTNFQVGGANYATGTGIFTAPTAGIYLFSFSGLFQNNASGTATLNALYFSKNNATAAGASRFDMTMPVSSGGTVTAAGNQFVMSGSVICQLSGSDSLRVKMDMGAVGGAGNFVLNINSHMEGYFLG